MSQSDYFSAGTQTIISVSEVQASFAEYCAKAEAAEQTMHGILVASQSAVSRSRALLARLANT